MCGICGFQGLTDKYILRETMKDVLPSFTANRRKQAFKVPFSNWLVEEFSEVSKDLLFSRNSLSSRLFPKRQIEELYQPILGLRGIERRVLLSRLFFLEMWYKIYKQEG